MGIFDPTNQGPQGNAFDGSHVSIKIGSVNAPENSIRAINPNDGMEGKELLHALGKVKPFTMTRGVYKPGEGTIQVYTASVQAVCLAVDSNGFWRGAPRTWEITLDQKSSPGAAALASALLLDTKSIIMKGLELTGMGQTFEVGGGASVTELKFMCLDINWMGMPGVPDGGILFG